MLAEASWQINALVLLGSLIVLLMAGVWIPVALGLSGLGFILLVDGNQGLSNVGSLFYNNVNTIALTAVPMFVFMGEIILKSKLMDEFYRSLSMWVRWLPGGLIHSQIAASAVMAAVTGSSVATAAAIGSASVPTLKERGYNIRRIYGALAAGGTLGILIPPSIIMIVYGALTQVSVAKLFVAAVMPGAIMVVLFLAFTVVVHAKPGSTPKDPPSSWHDKLVGLKDLVPIGVLLAFIIYSIYSGLMTPNEAGAIGALASLVLVVSYGRFNIPVFTESIKGTVNLSGMVLSIVISAAVYSFALVRGGVSDGISTWIADAGFSKTGVLLATALLILVLGAFVDGISLIYLALPVLVPVMVALDVDLVWFGIFVTILIEVGLIHPPLGLNLFVIQGIDPEAKMKDIVFGAAPYIVLMLFLVILMMIWPDIVLWLPGQSDAG